MARGYQYTKNEISEMLHRFYNKYGKSPMRKDFKSSNDLPSFKASLRIFGTTRWNDVLKEVGLPLNKSCGDYSKDDLISLLKEFYEKHGISPTISDMGVKNNYPSVNAFYKIFGTDSWNEILEECGLECNKVCEYSEEYALDKLREYHSVYGVIPTSVEYEKSGFRPSVDYFSRNFGSMENACYIAGLCEKPLTEDEKIEIAISELKLLAKKLGKCPTVDEYESLKHKGYSRRNLEKHLKMKYNDICKKYIAEYRVNIEHDYDLDDLKNGLTEIYNKLGRSPLFNELKDFGFNHDINMLTKYFGVQTYNQVIESMGWKPSGSTTLAKSEEQMLQEFYDYYMELGRIPYVEELNECKNTSSHPTYIKHFGNIQNICELLKIDFNKHYESTNVGCISFDLNGGLCRSKMEVMITNLFIKNKIKYIKEPMYKELVNIDNKYRFDWKIEINGSYIYIEYFGLYGINNSKLQKKYENKTHKKINLLKESNVSDKCLFLFPKNFNQIKSDISNFIGYELI